MRAILFVPGLFGTALVVGGFVSETYWMVGAGFGTAGVAAVVMLILKARDWLAIPRIQPGCDIQVRRDPADARKLVLDPALTPYRMD